MTWLQVFLLSIIQGLTEFLPISSSGHLAILQNFFNLKEQPIIFDTLVHLGTLFSIVILLRKDIWQKTQGIFKRDKESLILAKSIIIGTIPAIIFGLILNNYMEQLFSSIKLLGLSFIITGLLLLSIKLIKRGEKDLKELTVFDGLVIGLFQAIAIIPAISRSGATMVSSLWRGAKSETAFYFSFYLAIPAILGAVLLQLKDISSLNPYILIQSLVGMLISAIVGYFALLFVRNLLKNAQLFWFGIYCLFVGLLLIAF